MIVSCKAGDKFGVGNGVVLEILQICPELNAVEVRVTTPDGTYVELISPQDECDGDEEEVFEPVNRLLRYNLN